MTLPMTSGPRFQGGLDSRGDDKSEKTAFHWSLLAMVWSLYYVAVFTVSNYPQYLQKTIWYGGGLATLVTLPLFWRHVTLRQIPREAILLTLFTLWAGGTGITFVTDMALFSRTLKLMAEFAFVVLFVSVILKFSGAAKWFYLAFLSVAVIQVIGGSDPISVDRIADTHVTARSASANAEGFYCVMGIIGGLALFWETRRLVLRVGLAVSGCICLYGLVVSASRGALVALIATVILWPTMCLVGTSRSKVKAMIGASLILIVAFVVVQFIIQETYLGVRFLNATELEDHSSQARMELATSAVSIFLANPIVGCGLGQFALASGTGYYAHNELAEILGTTGLPGFLLNYSVYLLAWRRLSRSVKYVTDPLFHYRVNMARMILLVLLISGLFFRPNFISQDAMFLLATVIGIAHWAEQKTRLVWQSGRAGFRSTNFHGPDFMGG